MVLSCSMDEMLNEIRRTFQGGFYYAAIMAALALPDMCANLLLLETAKGTQKARYIKWYNDNVAKNIDILSGEDCWSLRCGVVHNGQFGNKDKKFDRVFFMIPPNHRMGNQILYNNVNIGGVQYGIMIGLNGGFFVAKMCLAAQLWFAANKDERNVVTNIHKLVRKQELFRFTCIA
jgi:hypothetical protein